jgi:hypothetical protein
MLKWQGYFFYLPGMLRLYFHPPQDFVDFFRQIHMLMMRVQKPLCFCYTQTRNDFPYMAAPTLSNGSINGKYFMVRV